jgi:hypothetical protein
MRGNSRSGWVKRAPMLKLLSWIGAGLVIAGAAAAEERGAAALEPGEVFWVQERPMSALVSTDLLAQDRRFFGGLGYGVNLAPPAHGPLALDATGRALAGPSGQLSVRNWHFGVDVLQSSGFGAPGSVAQFAMNYGGEVSDGLALSVGPTLSLGGAGTPSLFGAARSSGFTRLQNEAGVRDYGLRGAAVYSLSDSWALTGVLGYRRTLGELGATQSDDQFFSVLGLGYRF